MKKLIALLVTGLSTATAQQGAIAQELLISPDQMVMEGQMEMDGMTPDLALPPMPGASGEIIEDGVPSADGNSYRSDSVPSSASGDSVIQGESFSPDIYTDYGNTYHCDQPVLESTGSWLRRGFWYAEVDAVISNRKWSRDAIVLANQIVGITQVQFGGVVNTENQLRVNGRKPGAEGAPRLTLGHFLFRDHHNRDHTTEFTIYGGGEWTEEGMLAFNPNNDVGSTSLQVPILVDNGNTSFDGATSTNFRYDSRFNSFELNYLVKDRLRKDRMEMEPSGQWVRRAGPTFSYSYLAGLRFFDLTENFDWNATIDPDGDATTQENVDDDLGSVLVRTDNDLIGTQLGLSGMFETARWSAGLESKGGLYLNMIDMHTVFSRTQNLSAADDDILNDVALEADQLSFIGEAALVGRYHIKPNFSLRASFEFMFVSSVAIAPSQFPQPFNTGGPTMINSSGESTWMGGGLGFEGYW